MCPDNLFDTAKILARSSQKRKLQPYFEDQDTSMAPAGDCADGVHP